MHHPHVRYKRTTILLQKTVSTFKEVQLVQTQHHCDGCAAKRTATALVVHYVGTRLAETLMTARHQREACVTRCHETHLAGVNCVG